MLTATSVLRYLTSFPFLVGTGMVTMGLGVIDTDPGLAAVANVFLEPVGVPVGPFLVFLGSCKIFGVLSMWGIGPMPKSLGMAGLAISSLCGMIGHIVAEESPAAGIPAGVYFCMICTLMVLENGKKEEVKKE